MKKILTLVASAFMVCSAGTGFCQVNAKNYIEQVQGNATLFRGPAFLDYKYLFDGTFYIYEPEYSNGELFYNGNYYNNVMLNVNAERDELYVKQGEASIPIVLSKPFVEWFTLGGRRFVNITAENPVGKLGYGYYEAVYNGSDKILKKRIKKFTKRTGDDLSKYDRVYTFYAVDRYYLVKDDKVFPLKSVSGIEKIYKPYKKEIKSFVKQNNIKDKQVYSKEAAFFAVMDFIEKELR